MSTSRTGPKRLATRSADRRGVRSTIIAGLAGAALVAGITAGSSIDSSRPAHAGFDGTATGMPSTAGIVGTGETGFGPQPFFTLKRNGADFVKAGVTTRSATGQTDPFTLSVPPPGGPVARTFISWNYLLNGAPPNFDTIFVNNTAVSGEICGTGTPDLCWGKEGAVSYVATLPPGVAITPGNFTIAGATDKPLGSDPNALGEGLTVLVVFFNDLGEQRNVDVYCGYTSNTSNPNGIAQVAMAFSSTYVGNGAHFFLNGLDGQTLAADSFFINGIPAGGVVAGTLPNPDAWRGLLGPLALSNLYDHANDVIDAPYLAFGDTGLTASTSSLPDLDDCVGHTFGAISFECPKAVEPKWSQLPHNFPSTCCTPQNQPGCDNSYCEDLVCQIDAFCCDVAWDQMCVDQATDVCIDVCVDEPRGFNVPSDMDWVTLGMQPPLNPGPGPNWVIADDFQSDGRPITCVRWWGSYIDPAYEPGGPGPGCSCDLDGDGQCTIADLNLLLTCFGSPPTPQCPGDLDCDGDIDQDDVTVWECLAAGGPQDQCCPDCQTPRPIDGWLVSFHTDLPASDNPLGFSRPLDLLGLYFCPAEDLTILPTDIVGWDGHRVFEYIVELEDCHLVHAHDDPRPGAMPPDPTRPEKFFETDGFIYWLDIQAVVGHTYIETNNCPTCTCDANNDGSCDVSDLIALLGCFGGPPNPGCNDINCDGIIDQADVDIVQCFLNGNPGDVCCPDLFWIEVPTGNRAFEHFWGWHTSPDQWNDNSAGGQVVHGGVCQRCQCDANGDGACDIADLIAVLGCFGAVPGTPGCPLSFDVDCDGIISQGDVDVIQCFLDGNTPADCCPPDTTGEWIYIGWQPVDGTPHDLARVDQAFELLTPSCPEDTNGDGMVDIDDVVNVILDFGTDGSGHNGDVDCSGIVDIDDVVAVVLAFGPCP